MKARSNPVIRFASRAGLGFAGGLLGVLSIGQPAISRAQTPIELKIKPAGAQMELSWPAEWVSPAGLSKFPRYEVQWSEDLQHWQPLGQAFQGSSGSAREIKAVFDVLGPKAFYRVVGSLGAVTVAKLAANGDEVFGYASQFAAELERLGQISPEEFASRYAPNAAYLPALGWDPTTAQFWGQFNQNTNFPLNATELDLFKKNGFVVSRRLGSGSFGDLYYRIYQGDLPVFITTDSLLQAWHRSNDSMLEELEETLLSPIINQILEGMAAQLPAAWQQYGSGVLKNSIQDVDYFTTVARSLMAGSTVPSQSGQDSGVSAALQAINGGQLVPFDLFGSCRLVDFSQFKVRGHYENSELLKRYFRTLMWLGRIDFRVAGGPYDDCTPVPKAPPRELGSALILHHLLTQSGQFAKWKQFDQVLQAFVGWTDSMTFAQLGELLRVANIQSPADITSLAVLEKLQASLEQGQYGFQNIRGDCFVSPLGPEKMALPRSFTFAGQKFVLDSWALSRLVYDDILWVENGQTNKVMRRIPSALDVAFSVLGNNQVVPELVARMTAANGRQFRDGLPYQHNLAAARQVIESQNASAWEGNIYAGWLAMLRALSGPTTDPKYPEAMRTRAWAMKTLNTQLASWTQLRHDTIIYATPSYTDDAICSYPYGFVEPRPEFWQRLKDLADRTSAWLGQLTFDGPVAYQSRDPSFPGTYTTTAERILLSQRSFLDNLFSANVAKLKAIAEKELSQQPLTAAETDFLNALVQRRTLMTCVQPNRDYSGWYPQMFYMSVFYHNPRTFHVDAGCDKYDAIVVDIHTDPPALDVGDPGSVLHEGIGGVDLLMIAVDNGPDRMIYAGPLLSHYEFELIGPPKRLSDTEWKYRTRPPRPDWTRSYLVP